MKMIKITVEGTGGTTGAASAAIAVPVDASGVRAEKVLVTVEGSSYVLPGLSTVVATTESIIMSHDSPMMFDVRGLTHIAHLQLTAAQRITITPVD